MPEPGAGLTSIGGGSGAGCWPTTGVLGAAALGAAALGPAALGAGAAGVAAPGFGAPAEGGRGMAALAFGKSRRGSRPGISASEASGVPIEGAVAAGGSEAENGG